MDNGTRAPAILGSQGGARGMRDGLEYFGVAALFAAAIYLLLFAGGVL